ncbi:MAG: creatininase family protein [Candidatus Sumerlaeota bacterium]|nr:creatininase family protein [Candidatus Sumerlaeota bacterium]
MIPCEKILWEEMTPEELDSAIARTPLAYWPLGSLEWHGPHLPCGTDSLRAAAICQRAAAISGGVVLPPLYPTAPGFTAYRGSIYFSPRQVKALAAEMHRELAKVGFRALVQLLGHAGNAQMESFSRPAEESMKKYGLRILTTTGGGAKAAELEARFGRKIGPGHAGPGETAQCIAAARGKQRLDRFDPRATRLPRYEGLDPATYYDGLSEENHERVRAHMARAEWPWEADLVDQVLIPGLPEALLQNAAENLAAKAKELLEK